MADGQEPEIPTQEVDDLLAFFTEEQVRLMAERWDELRAAIRRWRIEHGESDGDSSKDDGSGAVAD